MTLGNLPVVGRIPLEMRAGEMRSINEILGELHEGLAEHLKYKLDEGTISVSELNVLRQFLKDNQISAQPVEGTPFGDLAAQLPDIENVVAFNRKAG